MELFCLISRKLLGFSLNAIVDVRRRRRLRRHGIILFNISEAARVSSFKIYHNVAHDSSYISPGSDFTMHFQSATNRTNVSILGHVQVVISQKWFN